MSRFPMILRKKSRITGRKVIDISEECDRISEICKDIAETKRIGRIASEREPVKALDQSAAGHFLRCPG